MHKRCKSFWLLHLFYFNDIHRIGEVISLLQSSNFMFSFKLPASVVVSIIILRRIAILLHIRLHIPRSVSRHTRGKRWLILHNYLIKIFVIRNIFNLDSALMRRAPLARIYNLIQLQDNIACECTFIKK